MPKAISCSVGQYCVRDLWKATGLRHLDEQSGENWWSSMIFDLNRELLYLFSIQQLTAGLGSNCLQGRAKVQVGSGTLVIVPRTFCRVIMEPARLKYVYAFPSTVRLTRWLAVQSLAT